jgi:preprotein translocase subunit SecG
MTTGFFSGSKARAVLTRTALLALLCGAMTFTATLTKKRETNEKKKKEKEKKREDE